MSFRIFDFKCETCGHVQERLVEPEVRGTTCEQCGSISERLISPVRCDLDGTDPDFPGAYLKWGRNRNRRGYMPKKDEQR